MANLDMSVFVACSTSDKHWGEKTWVRGYVLLLFGSGGEECW